MQHSTSTEPSGLYLHVPFCSAVCPYCDFAVLVGGAAKRDAYVAALEAELAMVARPGNGPVVAGPFDTVYFGGGTPSLLGEERLAQVLEAIRRHLLLSDDVAIFFEANPEDVCPASLDAWRRLGVSILTLGVQALDDDALRFLGRSHDAGQARRAIELACAAGFATVSFDLIYALPGQDVASWRRTLDQAARFGTRHLSCYQLTYEPRTPFGRRAARGEMRPAPDRVQAALLRTTHERLAEHGLTGYEVSNFARAPRHHSRHNRKYWRHVPYLGLGPSAHSFDGVQRWWNERHLTAWQRRLLAGERPIDGTETLEPAQRALETLMLGLRTLAGVALDDFARRFGVDLRSDPGLPALVERGWVEIRGDRLVPTLDGLLRADALPNALSVEEV